MRRGDGGAPIPGGVQLPKEETVKEPTSAERTEAALEQDGTDRCTLAAQKCDGPGDEAGWAARKEKLSPPAGRATRGKGRRTGLTGALLLLCGAVLGILLLGALTVAERRSVRPAKEKEAPLYMGGVETDGGGFSLAAASLYRETERAVSLLDSEILSGREYRTFFGAPREEIGAEQLRYYVRTGSYSDGRWPVFSLDETCEVQAHYDRVSKSVLIYAQPRREWDPENDNYQSPAYLFVPEREDFSAGGWYRPGDSDYRIQLDRAGRDTAEIYRSVKEYWTQVT